MSDPWQTALGRQARRIHSETKSIEKTAGELARKGATDDEIRELFYPALTATERRLLDRAIEFARADHVDQLAGEYEALIEESRIRRGEALPGPPQLRVLPGRIPTGPVWEAMVGAYRRWRGREGNADRRITKDELLSEAPDLSRDALDAFLRENGIPDFRLVRPMLRAEVDRHDA